MLKKIFAGILKFLQCKVYSYNSSVVWKRRWSVIKSKWLSYTFFEPARNCLFLGKVYLKDPHRIHLGVNNAFGDNLYLTAWSKFSTNETPALISIAWSSRYEPSHHLTTSTSTRFSPSTSLSVISNSLVQRLT